MTSASLFSDPKRNPAAPVLKTVEQQLRAIVEHSNNMFYIHDTEHVLVYISPQTEMFLDCAPEEALVRWTEFITDHPVNRKGIDITQRAIDTGIRQPPYELELVGKKGRKVWVEINESPVVHDGKTIAIIGAAMDISERKQNEIRLRASEQRFRELAELLPQVVFETDITGKILYANPMGYELFGYGAADLKQGINALDLIEPDEHLRALEAIQEVLKGNTTSGNAYTAIRKDGSRFPISMYTSRIIRNDEVVGLRGICLDLTQRVRMEEEKHELLKQLHHAQKMEAMGTLAGGIAHNFNNILTNIQGAANLMRIRMSPADPNYDKLLSIERQIQSASELTGQLLGLSQHMEVDTRPIDINHILDETATMFAHAHPEITIIRNFGNDLLTVAVDASQIGQVLLNIFLNAGQAMPQGGTLTLGTCNVDLRETRTRAVKLKPGKYVEISIADTGAGMDEVTLSRIFDPFFTTKARGGGTGLGLSSSYAIIKSHNGFIDVWSRKEKGSTFKVYLPATNLQPEQTATDLAQVKTGSGVVLVVDDDKTILTITADILSHLGYEARCADSGHRVLDMLKSAEHDIDLVVLDMVMPQMSGVQVLRHIRRFAPKMPVLLCSGCSPEDEMAGMGNDPHLAFIKKPYDIGMFSEKVKAMCRHVITPAPKTSSP